MARFDLHALDQEERYYRIILALVALLLGGVTIGIMTIALPLPGESAGPGAGAFNASGLLLGRGTSFPYPFTVRNLMWLMFFFALGELWVRTYRANREQAQLRQNALPANDPTVLFERGETGPDVDLQVGDGRQERTQLRPPAARGANRAAVSDQRVRRSGQPVTEFQPRSHAARTGAEVQHAALSCMADSDTRVHRHRDRHCPGSG